MALENLGLYLLIDFLLICKFNKKSRFVEPKDFEKIDGVKQVYEGKYLLMNENT